MSDKLKELDARIAEQQQRLKDRPAEPIKECLKSPTGKHDVTGNAYSRANGTVCKYCLQVIG